jgi:hypothetical protein
MVKKIIILLKGFLARFSVRVDKCGKKVLFVEEIQIKRKN